MPLDGKALALCNIELLSCLKHQYAVSTISSETKDESYPQMLYVLAEIV